MLSAFLSQTTQAEYSAPHINGTKAQQQALNELHHQFNVTTDHARHIVKQFMEEMKKGLDQEGATGK